MNTGAHLPTRPPATEATARPRRVVLVTGLSGAGKASILRVLEDLGYEAVDNPPLRMLEELAERTDRPIAICVDARSRGFKADAIVAAMTRMKRIAALRPELVFAVADTRRRHPMAPAGRVSDGVAAEMVLTAPLRDAADLVLDTTDLPLPMLRRIIEQRFSVAGDSEAAMNVSLISFAYPAGLPREAELVFDARFLRNPHYVPTLRLKTGLDPDVAAYVASDPDLAPFLDKITDLLTLLLPRFVPGVDNWGVGCGGIPVGWRVGVLHRELVCGMSGDTGDDGIRKRIPEKSFEGGQHGATPPDAGVGGLTETP